jgi:DNA-binding NtrC family response regulator
MEARKPKILLVGENPQGSSYLVSRLEGHGCECRFAASYQEACALLRKEGFDLVLSPIRLLSGSVFPLIDVLEGSGTTMFYSHAVEDSCWWLPALQKGQRCFGSPALRPSEFISQLDRIIEETQSGGRMEPTKQPPASEEPPAAKPARSRDGDRVRRKAAG